MCVHLYVGRCVPQCQMIRGQLTGVGFLLQCGSQGSNLGHQFWWQAPFPEEPFHQPQHDSWKSCCQDTKFSNYLICIIIFLTTLNSLIFLNVSIFPFPWIIKRISSSGDGTFKNIIIFTDLLYIKIITFDIISLQTLIHFAHWFWKGRSIFCSKCLNLSSCWGYGNHVMEPHLSFVCQWELSHSQNCCFFIAESCQSQLGQHPGFMTGY